MKPHSLGQHIQVIQQQLDALQHQTQRLSSSEEMLLAKAIGQLASALQKLAVTENSIAQSSHPSDATREAPTQAADDLMQDIGERVLEGVGVSEVLPLICDRFVERFGYSLAWIGMQEADGAIGIRAHAGGQAPDLSAFEKSRDDSEKKQNPIQRAIATKRTQYMTLTDLASLGLAEPTNVSAAQAALVIPLQTRTQGFGALTLYAVRPDAFDPDMIGWLEKLVSRISLILLLARDYENVRLQGAAMASAEHAVCIADHEGRIEWVNDAYTQLTGYSAAETIGFIPEFLKSSRVRAAMKEACYSLPWGQIWRSELVEQRKDGSHYTVEHVLTPLRNKEGEVTHFVAMHQDITARKEAEARIVHLAHHDALTDLPNRVLFHDRLTQALAQARRHKRLVAVMFLDLDQFKSINDAMGHVRGDELLTAVAERLVSCVRATDTVSRFSGDEFTLILQDLERAQDAGHVGQKILDAVSVPIQLVGREVVITTSLGIAVYPLDATEPDMLLKQADGAMYAAKEKGGNCYHFAS